MIEYHNMKPSELAEVMGAEFLKLMEAHFPMLCQLERQVADPHSDSDNPAVAMLGDHGAAWGKLLPEGSEDGDCLVWVKNSTGGGRWEPGEGGGGGPNNMSWTARVEASSSGSLHVHHLGGTVTFFGRAGTTFEEDEYNAEDHDAYCYLYWDADNGVGVWSRIISREGYPDAAAMSDGDVFIPLWKLVDGVLVQETVGAVVIPAIKNVVDRDEVGEPDEDDSEDGGSGDGGGEGEGGGEGGGEEGDQENEVE